MSKIQIFIYSNQGDQDHFKKIDLGDNSRAHISLFSEEVVSEKNSVILINSRDLKDCIKTGFFEAGVYAVYGEEISQECISIIYKHNIIDFIKGTPGKKEINSLIAKYLIQRYLGSSVEAIDHLIMKSVKIKSDRDLIQYVQEYLELSLDSSSISFIWRNGSDSKTIIGDNPSALKEILKIKLNRNFLGELYDDNQGTYMTAISDIEDNELWVCIKTSQADKFFTDLFFEQIKKISIYRNLKNAKVDLLKLAHTDEVTGLYNQRKLAGDLREEVLKVEMKEEEGFSLLFIDIDHFKLVNDNHGHVVGSNMLVQLGEVLKLLVRNTDSVYRYGGDEFIVLMRESKIDTVHLVATRVLEKIKNTIFRASNDQEYRLSVSIGISECPKDARTAKEILEFADNMMYKSKESGRGKIFHVTEV